jgi:hypothetical protein
LSAALRVILRDKTNFPEPFMTAKAPTYFEKTVNAKGKSVYLFTKRLNPKAGTFPLFKERVKLKMDATTDAEAVREAKTLAAELDLLQEVSRKDGTVNKTVSDHGIATYRSKRYLLPVFVESANATNCFVESQNDFRLHKCYFLPCNFSSITCL